MVSGLAERTWIGAQKTARLLSGSPTQLRRPLATSRSAAWMPPQIHILRLQASWAWDSMELARMLGSRSKIVPGRSQLRKWPKKVARHWALLTGCLYPGRSLGETWARTGFWLTISLVQNWQKNIWMSMRFAVRLVARTQCNWSYCYRLSPKRWVPMETMRQPPWSAWWNSTDS